MGPDATDVFCLKRNKIFPRTYALAIPNSANLAAVSGQTFVDVAIMQKHITRAKLKTISGVEKWVNDQANRSGGCNNDGFLQFLGAPQQQQRDQRDRDGGHVHNRTEPGVIIATATASTNCLSVSQLCWVTTPPYRKGMIARPEPNTNAALLCSA
jgi:hypothetical protein